jgi:hypothetical protein
VPCFETAHSKGLTGAFFGNADFKEVNSRQFKVEREKIKEGATPGVLQKSAEAADAKRVGGRPVFEECGRVGKQGSWFLAFFARERKSEAGKKSRGGNGSNGAGGWQRQGCTSFILRDQEHPLYNIFVLVVKCNLISGLSA